MHIGGNVEGHGHMERLSSLGESASSADKLVSSLRDSLLRHAMAVCLVWTAEASVSAGVQADDGLAEWEARLRGGPHRALGTGRRGYTGQHAVANHPVNPLK